MRKLFQVVFVEKVEEKEFLRGFQGSRKTILEFEYFPRNFEVGCLVMLVYHDVISVKGLSVKMNSVLLGCESKTLKLIINHMINKVN